MITISRLTVRELSIFVNDTALADRELLPISRMRAMSFMANPRADSSDVVMYLAYDFEKLIGYRTVLPDIAYVEGVPVKVVWLSGSWVHPDYRRRGISSELLNAINEDWEQRVLTSNFAPYAKSVYDKTHNFQSIAKSKGMRFYLKSIFLRTHSHGQHNFLTSFFVERFINFFNVTCLFRNFLRLPHGVELEYFVRPDNELSSMFEEATNSTVTGRSRIEWNWILRFPWVMAAPLGDRISSKYFFASAIPSFNQYIIKVYKDGDIVGMLHILHSHSRLTIPYSFFDAKNSDIMAKIVLLHAHKLKAAYITTYNPKLIEGLKHYRMYFIGVSDRKREYLATNYLAEKLKGSAIQFRDGDGDCAFV
ncbi:MAG: GNAT family N-acetyltransferase [Bacteroidales bacterium]